jgi:hypothetical protein
MWVIDLLISRSGVRMLGFECAQIAALPEPTQKQSVLGLSFFTVYSLHHELRDGSDVFEGSRLLQRRDKVPGFVDIVVEVPRGRFVKRLPDGALDYVGPMPSPFNYGSEPAIPAPDDLSLQGNIMQAGLQRCIGQELASCT